MNYSETKRLLDALLCDIYGEQQQKANRMPKQGQLARMASGMTGCPSDLKRLNVRELIDVCAILKMEILMMGYLLERVLIVRDRLSRHQEVLCEFVNAVLIVESNDAQPKMRFSLSPPPQKAINAASLTSTKSSTNIDINSTTTAISNTITSTISITNNNNMLGHESSSSSNAAASGSADDDAASDYNQWLHAMKLVARLPGGTPPEFRRKLWLSLADKYLKSKNVDWTQQREKCFCEEWREDDEELGIQIVKDLHRTGSNLCTGPAGSINQAKLKRILLGYARYNPEVGYCQGFNMLGALILQVMDKEEEESMKVMIYLVEGVLPTGYFYGSMGGLQADMGVFRELMQTKLPRLAKHLQRLQGGPVENAYEPPLTNVFTMQWFLTMFCTCLPMSCVLRVWDLVLIEGSDVLLRTALVLWSLLEERILCARSADEFYGKMGSFSSELLNGHLIDSNGLIEKVVKLGPIADLRQLRDKHLYNIAPLRHKQGIQLYYDDDDTHSDEERMAVATVWGLNWGRRGSVGPGAATALTAGKQQSEQKDRLALDISLLKKQYDRLRERQKQAHVILTTACSTATRQTPSSQSSVPVNQLLHGRPAIVTNKGKRVSAPMGAIPPARKPSLPAVLHANSKPLLGEKQLRRGETLLWRDTDNSRRRRDSLTWKEIKADRAAMLREGVDIGTLKTQKLRTRLGKSDSSSYSEDSDGEQEEKRDITGGGGSSSDTSLCDEDDPKSSEKSPKRKAKLSRKLKEKPQHLASRESSAERQRPKSWAPGTHEIPFMLMGIDSGDEKETKKGDPDLEEDSATESGRFNYDKEMDWTQTAGNLTSYKLDPEDNEMPLSNASCYPNSINISPNQPKDGENCEMKVEPIDKKLYDVSNSGVTNQYFERVNSVERPNRLELSYSLNDDDSTIFKEDHQSPEFELKDKPDAMLSSKVPQIRDDNIPGENKDDYKELLSMTIEEHKPPIPSITSQQNASRKRRDPRRKTLTRSSTIEIEERFQALERQLSQDQTIHKYIPSTAALEERYNSLEKQLSAEKQRKEEELDRIPSTADLETRFNALTKQMSSSESSSKAPVDLNKDEQEPIERPERKEETSENENQKKAEKTQSESKETETEKKSPSKKEESKDIQDDQKQPRLKKLPSTAELEDRFNALERKMSIQKSSPAKTKKEPPDEENAPKDKNQPKSNENKSEQVPEKTPEEKVEIEKSKSPQNSGTKRDEKDKVADARRKSPPSTEELEKRFNALEKQLSTTNLEPEQATTSKAKETKSKLPKETENVKENVQENQSKKSIKSFDEKVKVINTKLTAEEQKTKEEKLADEKRKSFDEKCKSASSKLKEKSPIKSETSPVEANESVTQSKELGKRRASEPPSTEDLEKRYETLKRRMSSKNHFSNLSESSNETIARTEHEVISETTEIGEPERKHPPPTTENLESRYEKLHGEHKSPSPKQKDVAIEAHISPPAPPPPPPPPPKLPNILTDPAMHQQRALIEELQTKIQEQGQSSPGEENLKPSEINPQRKQRQEQQRLLHRPAPMGDETSEAPANTAYYRSGNYEPWQQQHQQKQRMVRRFSDLPSRADLENRLQFLEKQLYKKFYKQRCASDSEVASRIDDDKPSTSARPAEVQLEQRVLALEKQLSENSLKLLEAMRVNVPNDVSSPRKLSTETIDATGKELVRYTQNFSEIEEIGGDGTNKPINISINIKMLVNKEQQQQRQQQEKAETQPNTDDLRLRLEQLEEQLMQERAKNIGTISETENVEDVAGEVIQLEKSEPEEQEANEKQEKDSHNQTVKSDEAEMLEDPVPHTKETIEPETVKETKTLENEEIAQASQERALKVEDIAQASQEKALKVEETEEKPKDDIKESDDIPNKDKPQSPKETSSEEKIASNESDKIVVNANHIEPPVDANNKTVVLLMDNEPRASRVRRLTRANTEELEGLFQALEKQLQDRNLIKSEDGRLIRANTDQEQKQTAEQVEQAQAISDLTKEIEDFTSGKPDTKSQSETKGDKPADGVQELDDYDWGPNPVKHHLKRKTVYLPSTKELEARFRSLERQIKLLEDVEKIDVEQRLNEIERKIKLQYSLSHEKDLSKYLELCEGKGLDDEEPALDEETSTHPVSTKDAQRSRSPSRKEATKSPYTSPSRKATAKSPYTSPSRKTTAKSPHTSPARKTATKSPYTSPSRAPEKKRSPYTSPSRRQQHPGDLPISDDLEYKYRVLDLVRSKSKENLSKRKIDPNKKPPIHPLEMLLDPSPDDSEIPTTGELEHRIRLLDEKLKSPSRHKSRSRSPTIDDMKRKKLLDEQKPKTPVHNLERIVSSPGRPEPPTVEELEERMRVLEEEKCFDFKTQKDYKAFNQKLKDVISPSLSFEEFKAAKSREQSPRRQGATTPKSALRRDDYDDYRREETPHYRPTSPKVIRFRDEDEDYYENSQRPKSRQSSERMVGTTNVVLQCIEENTKILQRILKKTIADRSYSSSISATAASSEGLDALGSRLMRETSPITRTGTHTGVPLRTGENINDRLSSIKDTIKSIDTLCEEKPYQKEKCQRYIDSLFSDSTHFASKKSSLEDLTHSHSRSESRGRTTQRTSDYTPAIRITSEHRSLGSADSLRTSPLRTSSPLHHRSHRDISRELSPRRRRDAEDLEERESSRVRRDNMLPNYFLDNRSELSSASSLTKFHKVDRQLEETCAKYEADDRRSASRTPLSSPYESRTTATRYNNTGTGIGTATATAIVTATATTTADTFQRPVSPYRQPYDPYRRTVNAPIPVYQPAKLEIRHTTVTSTFYDRFLTEKQIEKQTLSRPPSRSPIVSPSATAKSYTDLPGTLNSDYKPIATTSSSAATMSSSYAGTATSFSLPTSNYSYLMNSSTSLANTTTVTSTTSTTISSSVAYVPYNFSSSFSNRLNDPITSSSGISSGSTGVYNPMMSFTLREPTSSTSGLLGQYPYKSTFISNYSSSNNPKSPSDQDKL